MTWQSIVGKLTFYAGACELLQVVMDDDFYDESIRRIAHDLWYVLYIEYQRICRAAGVSL